MQNLITLVGLATLANATSLVSRTESNMDARPKLAQADSSTYKDAEDDLELGKSFMFNHLCKEDPEEKDECC